MKGNIIDKGKRLFKLNHSQSLLSTPEFQLYLAMHTEVKTMVKEGVWRVEETSTTNLLRDRSWPGSIFSNKLKVLSLEFDFILVRILSLNSVTTIAYY